MKTIGVVGGGMIGASMACLFAGHGVKVVLVERDGFWRRQKQIARASSTI